MSLSTHAGISNEDIMSSIFMKLPVKSVLKCRCVCKTWESIASNPYFCRQHASLQGLNPSPSAFIFNGSVDGTSNFELFSLTTNSSDHDYSTSKIISFDYLNTSPGYGNLLLLSSCNGLLLFQTCTTMKSFELREYYVCNPTTKKSLKLALPNYLTSRYIVDASLVFDPCVSPHYKVVFLWTGSEYRYCITMYSSKSKRCGRVSRPSRGYCNGKIHLSPTAVCPWIETLASV